MHIVGIPLHWGFIGAARKGFGRTSLTPSVGDANIETPEYKAFLVDIEDTIAEPAQHRRSHMAADARRTIGNTAIRLDDPPPLGLQRGAAADPPAGRLQVAKLIDVSKCIGCKACQAACLEWNDLREEIGYNRRRLRQPARPDAGHR